MNGNDMAKLKALAEEYLEFINQFSGMFVQREQALLLVKYALLIRQHLLYFGPPGTSKTALCDTIYSAITDTQKFSTELTAFMTETNIFGPYDVKVLREQGSMIHRTRGMLPEAEFARLGELLDANPQTLRSLLGAMNERRMMRGEQQLKLPLKTVYCDTNKDPGEYIRRNPDSFAVLDRILFIGQLGYLSDADDVKEMVVRFQRGKTTQVKKTISASVIDALSRFIVLPPGLITDETIMDTYAKAVAEYRTQRQKMSEEDKKQFILPEISDRRVCYASQLLEAEAILDGRTEARIDDLQAAGIVLCTSPAEHALWDQIAETHVKVHKQNEKAQTSTAQGLAIKGILDQLHQKVLQAPANTPAKEVGHTLQVLSKQLASISPNDPAVQKLQDGAKTEFAEALESVQKRVLAESGVTKLHFS